MATIQIYNKDCMDLMAQYEKNAFDLAIVDPPYGIGKTWKKDVNSPFYHHNTPYKSDKIPNMEYFIELFRVSKHQIIFGANYFIKYIPEGGSWIVWDKVRTDGIRSGFELAWTSIKKANSIARFMWDGFKTCCKRIGNHPHEKPIKLYAWLLTNYAKPDWKILDTHLGSGTSAIACIDAGLNLMACEIDETYYKQAKEVIRKHEQQQQLFTAKETTVFYSLFGEYLGGIDAKAHHK